MRNDMILSIINNEVFHVSVALLREANGNPIRFFGGSAEVIDYLKAHADTDFLLEPKQLNAQQYGPPGEVFCGQIKFDAQSQKVICS